MFELLVVGTSSVASSLVLLYVLYCTVHSGFTEPVCDLFTTTNDDDKKGVEPVRDLFTTTNDDHKKGVESSASKPGEIKRVESSARRPGEINHDWSDDVPLMDFCIPKKCLIIF